MRTFGINFDTGFTSARTTTREPFDPAVVRREMEIIRTELHCDAVRITGGDRDRLETAARLAAEAGLGVWYCPFTNGLTQDELLDLLTDSAGRAEKLRRDGAEVIFLTGSEISLFTDGFLPGDTTADRVAVLSDPQRLRAASPALHARINAFLGTAITAVRTEFGGRIGYASLPFEGVDWTPFDLVATDAGYRDAGNADQLADGLRALTSHGKPAAVTEFGCAPIRGGAAIAGRADAVIEWDDRARPAGFTRPVVRDEREQADYVTELLGLFENSGIEAAFVYTFARYDLPHDGAGPDNGTPSDDRDFDKASLGVVKVLTDGRTGTTYPGLPWEPKAAFHALANYGRRRAGPLPPCRAVSDSDNHTDRTPPRP
uniref:Abortive infection protein n=1 Tax=Streptomyces sp. NBC_01401 TaxID=2903854 RepID=A0AAU3GSI7_9ACTN